ncbi:integrator complex subunit 5-like [Macrosteles quadrilineatus]|uniref:integrator complex subunit 5-like n=1 Tax=Macrosteles quadrilineatus TaxID=74068 RepID=UPI0023E0B6D3|nr:integrator complex subunit 5-like [Macrosteles quadrilineatus]
MEGEGPSGSKTAQPADLYSDFRKFIAGTSGHSEMDPSNLAHLALSLLKNLFAARDAVLEYFCSLFDAAVSHYVKQIQKEASTKSMTPEEATIAEIHTILCSYVSCNTESWAPIISTWSLELLGVLSSKYASVSSGNTLNETLHLWMSCHATRTLIDLNTQCLTCLMHSNTDACINALLDTSVLHSPHFDWVVAHVGSAFPHTVIKKVLSCGLKDFCENQQGTKAPKINSVVGILGHLAGSHLADIRGALLELFQWSLEDSPTNDKAVVLQRVATVPYLLQLAHLSPILLEALSTDVVHSLDCSTLRSVCQYATDWCCYLGGRHKLQELVVHLVLNCSSGGEHIFKLFLDASQDPYKPLSNNAWEILELVLVEMSQQLRMRDVSLPLLNCVHQNITSLQPLLLSNQPLRTHTIVSLLTQLGWQDWNFVASSLSYLLLNATSDWQLAALMRLIESHNGNKSLNKAVTLSLTSTYPPFSSAQHNLWFNVEKLLKWEMKSKQLFNVTVAAVRDNMSSVAKALTYSDSMAVSHAIMNVIERSLTSQPKLLQMQTSLWCTHAVVHYFLNTLQHDEGVSRMRGCRTACKMLTWLCQTQPGARPTALRAIVEAVLDSPASTLFGRQAPKNVSGNPPPVSLLQENLKQTPGTMMAQKHLSVFHAGVIGYGLRLPPDQQSLPEAQVCSNTRLLMSVVVACCQDTTQVTLDSVTRLALLLVEMISPDVMYNGLPWPEEDFCKVTVERDLHIANCLKSLPVVWTLLRLIASFRPALCTCSVLLRALAAVLVGEWQSAAQQGKGPGQDSGLVQRTVSLLQVMALGQLLPPPLSSISLAIPHLPPQQVVLLLRECVWNYMRDHVPAPALFTQDASGTMWRDPALSRPPKQYTETFRLILQRNIGKMGQLYAQLFIMSPTEP